MSQYTIIVILTSCLFLFGCSTDSKIITIKEKTLIPEGIAVDNNGHIYLSNLYTKNIIRVVKDNSFILSNKYSGYYEGLGITIDGDTLFALGNRSDSSSYKSVLEFINVNDGKLIKAIESSQNHKSFLNDLVVFKDKKFITNSDEHSVYTIYNGVLTPFIKSDEIEYPNGITISDDGKILYIASSTKGIRSYDINNQKFVNEVDNQKQTIGIDGLKYYNHSLYAVQNGFADKRKHALIRYNLDNLGHRIIKADTLLKNHKQFNIPTTLDIRNGHLYCLMNSQMEHLLGDSLIYEQNLSNTFVYMMKLKPNE